MEGRKIKIKKISESIGRVFDERGGINVAYEFVVHGFDTTVGESCWWRRGWEDCLL